MLRYILYQQCALLIVSVVQFSKTLPLFVTLQEEDDTRLVLVVTLSFELACIQDTVLVEPRFAMGHPCQPCNACAPEKLAYIDLCDVPECEPCAPCFPNEVHCAVGGEADGDESKDKDKDDPLGPLAEPWRAWTALGILVGCSLLVGGGRYLLRKRSRTKEELSPTRPSSSSTIPEDEGALIPPPHKKTRPAQDCCHLDTSAIDGLRGLAALNVALG